MNKQNADQVTISDISSSYDELFKEKGRLRDTETFYQWILNKLIVRREGSLLDIACGEGILLMLAEKIGLQCHGIDLSRHGALLAINRTKTKNIVIGNGEQLPYPSNSFDYVTNIGSLEHFLDPMVGLEEIGRVMRSTGIAALILPNSYYLVDIIWQVWRTGYSVSHKQLIERFASYHEWGDFIEMSGLHIVKAYKYNIFFPRSLDDLRWYRQHPRKLLNLLYSPYIQFNLSNHFLYVCRKGVG
jgi:ubiquinone/menaquinone biosynthesis C-methylase UbiE